MMKMKKIMIIIIINLFIFIFPKSYSQKNEAVKGWKNLTSIMKRIIQPKFPAKIFNIESFGAKGDGKTDCTEAFRKAIDECSKQGGGKVSVPKGIFLSGAIHLKNNVNLYIQKGATIKFYTEPQKYLPVVFTRWEGVECMNYSSLIYAFEQENIAVSGEGMLDGSASDDNWWIWKGNKKEYSGKPNQNADRDKLMEMGEKEIPVNERVFGDGHYLRPNFVQFYKCKNILISGVTIINSPMWVIHPVLSKNITVRRVRIEGLGPNTDGCNPESCSDVLIKDCYFDNGDDCIAIKSGRNNDGRRVNIPTENVVIQGCAMKNGHGGVVIGSEISGSVRNVYAENCIMDSPNLDRALRFKTNSCRGGITENIFVRNISVGQVGGEVILVDFNYGEGDKGQFTPVLRNIFIENLKSGKSPYAIYMKAYERSPANNIHLKNCTFNNVEKPNILEHVTNIKFENVKINGKIQKNNNIK